MNRKKFRSFFFWIEIAATVWTLCIYAAVIRSMVNDSPISLHACMEVDTRWRAWTCEQVLRHGSLTKDHVRQLNLAAGARFPLLIKDLGRAEEMLTLFLARGVDINAPDQETKRWTALHGAAIGEPSEKIALLFVHGAKAEVRDADGRTPLDLALLAQRKRPDDSQIAENIRLLEAAQRKASP